MLGPYSLLPLLKGWEYKTHDSGIRTITSGANPIEVIRAPNELGWLQNVTLASTDCYAGIEMIYQGGDLQTDMLRTTIQNGYTLGAIGIGADPGGFIQLYYRPVPTSTYGAYIGIVTEFYYGNPIPYLPTVIVRLYLDSLSTQSTSEIQFSALAIHITNRQDFIRSLRKVLGTKNMVIDPALLQYGQTILNQLKGEEWKAEAKEE